MKPDHGAPSGLLPTRCPARSLMPVLIQVPALPGTARRPGRPDSVRGPARRRRRLRREVRAVGSALLIGLTMTLGLLPIRAARTLAEARPIDAGPACDRPALAAADAPPVVSLSCTIEPAAPAPVVLPGYIVPDDRCEEPPHAGN